MNRWIEPRDLPWAARRLARQAAGRLWVASGLRSARISDHRPEDQDGGSAGSLADRFEVARRNIESTLAGDPDAPDVRSIVRRHHEFLRVRLPAPGSRASGGLGRWPITGREHLEGALAEGRGAILATAHVGWWLLVAPILRLHGFPVIQTGGPWFERRRRSRRDRARGQSHFRRFVDERTRPVIPLGPEDLPVTLDVRPILAALARNRPLLIAGDGKRSLEFATFPLLGRPYPLPVGFVKLAIAARCPVVPVFALEGERSGTVRLEVRPPLAIDPAASPLDNLALYARVLDEQVRATPHLWCRWGNPEPFAERRAWVEGGYLAAAGGRDRASATTPPASEPGKLPGSRSK